MNYDEGMPFAVSEYRHMQKALPGVESLYQLMQSQIETALPEGGHVLIAGAGGGREIEALSSNPQRYRMTAVDPSNDMLDMARWYAQAMKTTDQVEFIQSRVQDLQQSAVTYDAATSMLVMHFLPDDGSKLAYLQTLRQRLESGAILVLADVSFDSPADFERMRPVFLKHAALAGLTEPAAATGPEIISQMPIIGAWRTRELIEQAGFVMQALFFQALWYRGWVCAAA